MYTFLIALLSNTMFISYIRSKTFDIPLTKKEEQFYLAKLQLGDQDARNTLIEKNLRLVAHIAKKYENSYDSQEDLISIGTIGLIKAIDSFQNDKNTKLSTYASRCIDNEILMHLRATKKTHLDVSLNDPIGIDKDGSEITLQEVLDNGETPIQKQMEKKEDIEDLLTYFSILSDKEKDILIHRYGLFHQPKYTQNQIAKHYHISRSYISRIEKRAMIKILKEYLKDNKKSPHF